MDYAVTAKRILECLGGEGNIFSATHCMTRLRIVLKDESIVNDDDVKAIPGVVGVMRKSGQYQIIIGNNVAKCYREFAKLGSFSEDAENGPSDGAVTPPAAILPQAGPRFYFSSSKSISQSLESSRHLTGRNSNVSLPKNVSI